MAQDVPRFGNKYMKNLIKYRQIYSGITTQISIIDKKYALCFISN